MVHASSAVGQEFGHAGIIAGWANQLHFTLAHGDESHLRFLAGDIFNVVQFKAQRVAPEAQCALDIGHNDCYMIYLGDFCHRILVFFVYIIEEDWYSPQTLRRTLHTSPSVMSLSMHCTNSGIRFSLPRAVFSRQVSSSLTRAESRLARRAASRERWPCSMDGSTDRRSSWRVSSVWKALTPTT